MKDYSLDKISDTVVLRNTDELIARDCLTTAELLAHVAAVDERKLYLMAAFPSMVAWCCSKLRMTRAAAFRRIQAARTAHQYPAMFPAHVTLCREDEASDWDSVVSWLREIGAVEVALSFGKPMREGNLVYLPALGGMSSFDALRKLLLAPNGAPPRVHSPYITLIHPRNGTCSDSDFAELAGACEPFSATFRNVTLIEQVDSLSWRDVATSG